MRIIIPMAGRGSRLRPHTLTTPKPLVPIAGKPIVHRLAEDIVALYNGPVEEIAFIIGDFGKEVETQLVAIAEKLGAKGTIYHQEEALGTAHAIYQARESMEGELIIAFADTLFRADFSLDREKDGAIWVNQVEDPRPYGVVTLDEAGIIQEFVEKPETFVSDLAIIGIYYIKSGEGLVDEIQYLLDNDIREKGEYQLTNALENLKAKGKKFVTGEVKEWMDCGNKKNVLDTTKRILEFAQEAGQDLVDSGVETENAVVIQPCFIGEGVKLTNSVIGPFVSIGANSVIEGAVISNSAIGSSTTVKNAVLNRAMVGSNASVDYDAAGLDIGDYCRV
ncbi:MAG: sugar phosphate nucleotidyltransferase [Bacteroidota bacterium]